MLKPDLTKGVAPIWSSVTDGAGWTGEGVGFYVEGAGDVAFVSVTGTTITRSFPDNFLLPGTVKQILNTAGGTTATGIMVATLGP